MNALKRNPLAKGILGLLIIALLTGCAYYGVIGVGLTMISADDWAEAVLGAAMQRQTQTVMNYYEAYREFAETEESEIPDWSKEQLGMYAAQFDPTATNFRYTVTDEDGAVLFGNYEGEAYIVRSSDWQQRFVGTKTESLQLQAYQDGRIYDNENDRYLYWSDEHYPVDETWEMPKEYVAYDSYGNFYNEDGEIIAYNGNFYDEDGGFIGGINTAEELPDARIVVDGTTYYPISPESGYPSEFAYYNDYGKLFDRELNYIMHMDEYANTHLTPTPRVQTEGITPVKPTSTPAPVAAPAANPMGEVDAVEISVMTQEEYEALYDACYEEYTIRGYLPEEMAVEDGYSALYRLVMDYDGRKAEYLNNAGGMGLGALVLLAVLLVLAGKRDEEGNVIPGGTGRLPWDVWLVGMGILVFGACCVAALAANLVMEGLYYSMDALVVDRELVDLVIRGCVAAAAVCIAVLVGILHSAAARVKVKGWWRNCLSGRLALWCLKHCVKAAKWLWRLWLRIWRGCVKTVGSVPLVWKGAVVLGAVAIVQMLFFGMFSYDGAATLIAVLWNILLFLVGIIICLMLKRLQVGARTIADGDLDHRIDTKNLYLDLKDHAECLNRIGDGLSHSVDAQLRSERMKTELITNVSHDLKTPLTSIVNYVDLLKKEELTGTAAEYVEVLDRQSARLKKLTEDLVEASKASSGALQVKAERVNLTELLQQAQAEYAGRLMESHLQPVVRVPDAELAVWADGKYIWRIMDNLLSNVCKYAMPGTRVYLELRSEEDKAVISVKNMSRDGLNISAEELMERFVRGDSSRNTEGSGLGLSIAQSLAKLMGGQLRITIDGDLFKADVLLPLTK